MSIEMSRYVSLNDADLLREVHSLTGRERTATAHLIAALSELDARRLYLPEGCSSLFTYCTQVLHLSEHAAYGRIEAARAARKWPIVLELLANGSLHLTAVTLLSRHLTTENHEALLAAARHKSKREIEEMVAAIRPQPAVPSSVRKVPASATPPPDASRSVSSAAANDGDRLPPSSLAPGPAPAAAPWKIDITPLAPARYKLQFTVTRETYGRLRDAQDLLRHRIPNGDVGAIFDRALSLLLQELHKTRHGATDRPRVPSSGATTGRHVPAAVKRVVWDRDDGRCAFVGQAGRCAERGFLEYHHLIPFADGGPTSVDNLELRCRAHNRYEAERWFDTGEEAYLREAAAAFG